MSIPVSLLMRAQSELLSKGYFKDPKTVPFIPMDKSVHWSEHALKLSEIADNYESVFTNFSIPDKDHWMYGGTVYRLNAYGEKIEELILSRKYKEAIQLLQLLHVAIEESSVLKQEYEGST